MRFSSESRSIAGVEEDDASGETLGLAGRLDAELEGRLVGVGLGVVADPLGDADPLEADPWWARASRP